MHLRSILLLALLLPYATRANDPLEWSELQLLYAADLAVDARYVREDEAHVWVRVVVVLRDRRHGIVPGDHLRVDKAAFYDCGFAWNVGDMRRWRMYLQKEEGKGHWALCRHDAGSAIHFIRERAILHMPAWVELPIAEFDRCLIEFQTCYTSADSGNTFTALCDQVRIDSLAAHNAVLAQFERQGRTVTGAQVLDPVVVPLVEAAPPPIRDCPLLEQRPRLLSDPEGAALSLELLDPTPDAEGPGKVYLRVLVDLEGRLRDATILRRSTPERDTEALRALARMPRVEPGRSGGVATACYEVVQFSFVIKEH